MKTAMQELIDKLKIESNFITKDDHIEDRMFKKGIDLAIYISNHLLEKEKELACQFAQEYINGASYDTLRDYYDEKFELQPNL